MKIRKVTTKEFDVPNGDYCQKADGSINCKQLSCDHDIFGVRFYCGVFHEVFHIPFDGKLLCAKRDIRKCEECARLSDAKKAKTTREDDLHKPLIKVGCLPISFVAIGTHCAIALCPVCRTEVAKRISDNERKAIVYVIEEIPNYCPHCGARLKEVSND